MDDVLIRFSGIKKAFGPKIVFNGLNLDVERGEFVALVPGAPLDGEVHVGAVRAVVVREDAERGLLDSTIVWWGGEFGRTPTTEGEAGRVHGRERDEAHLDPLDTRRGDRAGDEKELEHAIERAVVITQGRVIGGEDLPEVVTGQTGDGACHQSEHPDRRHQHHQVDQPNHEFGQALEQIAVARR